MTNEIKIQHNSTRSMATKGVLWSLLEILFKDVFSLIMRLILVRLILPEEFGLIGMAVVFTGFVSILNEMGLSAALIQKKEELLSDNHYQTVFWATTVFSVLMFIFMLFIASPLVASFYNEPSLTNVIRVLSLPIIFQPFILIPRVKMTRDLDFKKLAIINVTSSFLSGLVSLVLALMGLGVWAIASQGTIQALIIIPLVLYFVKWRPNFNFSFDILYEMLSFSSFVLIKSATVYFVTNIDYLFVGIILNSYYVGIYTLAFTLTDLFRNHIMGVLNKVMHPIYSKNQDNPIAIGKLYLKVIKYNTAIIFPLMIGIFFVGQDFILIFYGNDWIETVWPLKILSIAVVFHSLVGSSATVLMSIGKVKLDFKIYLTSTILITVPLLYILTYYWGVNGAAFAILVSKIINLPIVSTLMKFQVNVGLVKILKNIFPNLVALMMMVISLFLFNVFYGSQIDIFRFFVKIIVGALSYIITIIPFYREEISLAMTYIRKLLFSRI